MRRPILALLAVLGFGCATPAQGPAAAAGDVTTVDADVLTFDAALPDASDVQTVDVPDSLADQPDAPDVAPDLGADAWTDAAGQDGGEVDAGADVDAGPPVCADAQKRCDHAFTYAGDGTEFSVEVRGSFDGWKKGIAMAQSGNDWSVTAGMPWNTAIQYKFHITTATGAEVWKQDPGNLDAVDDTFGGKNSLLQPSTCATWTCAPAMTVCGVPAKTTAFDWRDGVMYFVFVDRFANGNPANDGKNLTPGVADLANWSGGDWAGVQKKVEEGYFTALGVNVLWLTVPMDNTDAAEPGADGKLYTAYHGYWPRDTAKTNAHFGSMADLQALVAAAHKVGIQIVLDYAMNHVHKDSPTFQAHVNDGWFHPLLVDNQECVCGSGVCPWEGPSSLYCWFRNYLPDFDMTGEAARKASIDNVVWWMQQSGADGLRLDAIKHVEAPWLTEVRQRLLTDVEPGKQQHVYLVGETFSGDQGFIKTFVDPCTKLDGQFDFPERAKLASVVLLRQGKLPDLEGFLNQNDGFYGPDALMSTFLGNHDLPRSIHLAQDKPLWTDVWADGKDKTWQDQPAVVPELSAYERLALGMTVLMTNRGVPLLYYGDEIGLAGAGDPDNRRPMPWTGYTDGQKWLLGRMKALGQARAQHVALRQGTRTTVAITDDAWLYVLKSGSDQVFVAINRGEQAVTLSGLPGQALTDLLSGESVTGPSVVVPARGARVLPVP
jgi:glycosidase